MTFKLACLVYQLLSGNAPMYLADNIHLLSQSDRRQLRSSSTRSCIAPRTHNSYGDRSFAANGPRLWNSLFLFEQTAALRSVTLALCALYKYSYLLTYLLTCAVFGRLGNLNSWQ